MMQSVNTVLTEDWVAQLNEEFRKLDFGDRIRRLYDFFPVDQVLFTSSFGTKSVVMLYLVSQANQRQSVTILNTGYHFPETLAYRQKLHELTGLPMREVKPDEARHELTRKTEMWNSNSDRCCHYNKVMPLRELKKHHRVWMSGVHAYQTMNRQSMDIWELVEGLLHFHPLIDISEGEFLYLLDKNKLPRHPLEALGYGSIGCTHCTRPGAGRAGRWADKEGKDECGLHL
ncbi:MAG: phosphoadenylyl-sulfate reductase [Bacteroidota bacterium]